MLGALVIDRAAMFDAKRTWHFRANLMAPNFDLQPTIAARSAGTTAPSVVGLFHPTILCNAMAGCLTRPHTSF
jgi:hypothetical protein